MDPSQGPFGFGAPPVIWPQGIQQQQQPLALGPGALPQLIALAPGALPPGAQVIGSFGGAGGAVPLAGAVPLGAQIFSQPLHLQQQQQQQQQQHLQQQDGGQQDCGDRKRKRRGDRARGGQRRGQEEGDGQWDNAQQGGWQQQQQQQGRQPRQQQQRGQRQQQQRHEQQQQQQRRGGPVRDLDRIRALCGLVGIGSAAAGRDPDAQQAAIASVRDGSAFRRTAYADAVSGFLPPQQQHASA